MEHIIINIYITILLKKKDKKICILKIEETTKPIFLKYNGKNEFYIRVGTTTRPLDQKETTEYIADKYTN